MNAKALLFSAVVASGLLFSGSASAQSPKLDFPSPSPLGSLKQRVGLTDIEISYSRPGVKGRPIFGGLLPYGEVWRTGANGRTTISFSTPVKLEGKDIPAGQYSLFTIPGESEWTVIINKDVKSSPFAYNPTNDVVRFTTRAIKITAPIETFSIVINAITDDSARIDLLWEHTVVPIHLTTDLVTVLGPQIEAAMAASGEKKQYYQAAMFYYDHGLDLHKAKDWVDSAIVSSDTYFVENLKAKILVKLGDKEGAIAAAKKSSALAEKADGASGYLKLNQELIDGLK